MIELSENEKKIVLICKMHFTDKYPNNGSWLKNFEKLWIEIYAWDPNSDNNYYDYMEGLFFKLYEIYEKIKLDKSGTNLQMRELFKDIFYDKFSDEEKPIVRGINTLCSLIQGNEVTYVLDDKVLPRYELDNSILF